jgi:drug/metabolite transporter superfamily protein YnfA
MSFGLHLAAAVLSLGGILLAQWLRDRARKAVLSLAVFAGVLTGMVGLALAAEDQGRSWSPLGMWFAIGVLMSLLA